MTQNVPETYTPETFRRYAAEVLKLELGTDEEIEQLREAVNGLLAELTPLDLVELGPLDPAIRFNPGTGDQV